MKFDAQRLNYPRTYVAVAAESQIGEVVGTLGLLLPALGAGDDDALPLALLLQALHLALERMQARLQSLQLAINGMN